MIRPIRFATCFGAGMLALALTAGTSPLPAADDDVKASAIDLANAKKTADMVRTINIASELASHGRDQKSALQLLTAATLLQRTGVVPSKAKPKVELPEGEKASDGDDKEAPPASMRSEAAKLLDEAEKMARGNDTLLKSIALARDQKLEDLPSLTRGGNPQSYSRRIRRGATHTYEVNMIQGTPCIASIMGNGNRFTISVTGAGGVRHGQYTGPNPSITWNAGRQRRWIISVTNHGPAQGNYTLTHN